MRNQIGKIPVKEEDYTSGPGKESDGFE